MSALACIGELQCPRKLTRHTALSSLRAEDRGCRESHAHALASTPGMSEIAQGVCVRVPLPHRSVSGDLDTSIDFSAQACERTTPARGARAAGDDADDAIDEFAE